MDKKSFLLYFDMQPHLNELSHEQRGLLFSALFDYALREAHHPTPNEEVLRDYPGMTPDTCMAFGFIAATIRRDTDKWREKQRRYQKAALERHGKGQTAGTEAWQYI